MIGLKRLAPPRPAAFVALGLGGLVVTAWVMISWRITAALLLPVMWVTYATLALHGRLKLTILLTGSVALLASIPIDVRFVNRPGPPAIVPFVKGLASDDTAVQAERGELYLGSDVVSGFEPRWILVW